MYMYIYIYIYIYMYNNETFKISLYFDSYKSSESVEDL